MGNKEAESDNVCGKFYSYLESAIDAVFQKKKYGKQSKFPKNEWFDDNCKKLKKRTVNDFGKANDLNNADTWGEYNALQKDYKRVINSTEASDRT